MARRPSSRGPIDTYLDSLGLYRLKVPPQEPLFRIVAEQVSHIAVPLRPVLTWSRPVSVPLFFLSPVCSFPGWWISVYLLSIAICRPLFPHPVPAFLVS